MTQRILVLEDEAVIAMLIEDTLTQLGYEVIGPFRTVERAEAALASDRPDGALLDLNLGRGAMSYPIATILAERKVPFMFLTGYGERAVDPAFAGRPLLNKPFSVEHLGDALQALLQQTVR